MKDLFKQMFSKKNLNRTLSYTIVVVVYLVVQALITTGNLSNLMKTLLIPTCSYIVAALALNLLVGILGDLCLGQAGFMGVGAFAGVVAAAYFGTFIHNGILVLILSLLFGGVVAGLFGVIIGVPVLKLQGDYLAIVTLAFCQIIKTVFTNVYTGVDSHGIHLAFLNNNIELAEGGQMVIKGALGTNVTNRLSTFTAGVVLILFTLFVIYNLLDSKSGRAIMACRDNKIAASSVGISTTKFKLMTFVISAALAGMAGALYGLSYSSFKAMKFDFNLSIMILVYVVLGGLGNMTGTVISTTVLIILPEKLRAFQDYRMIIYAVVLILVMLATNNKNLMNYLQVLRNKLFRTKEGAKTND